MANVFFFDLRDGNTNNFSKLSDEQYLFWDKKNKHMEVGDYCIIYYGSKEILVTSEIEEDKIYPKQEDGKWFIDYKGKQYDFESNGQYDEFVAFKKMNEYHGNGEDFKISAQGGITLLTGQNPTKFKETKLDKVLGIIEEKSIKAKFISKKSPKLTMQKEPQAISLLGKKKQVILYGPPGTGKTYNTKFLSVSLIEGCIEIDETVATPDIGVEGAAAEKSDKVKYELKQHLDRIVDVQIKKLVQELINKTIALSSDIKIRLNQNWVQFLMPKYVCGISCRKKGFQIAFKPIDIDLTPLDKDTMQIRYEDAANWVYVSVKNDSAITVDDLMVIIKRARKINGENE